jgi:hypothetical protein
MERTTGSQGHVNSVSHDIGQGAYYNDAHPALFHALKASRQPTHIQQQGCDTETTDATAEYGSTSELPV